MHSPLILTLELDPESFHFFNDLRRTHFPVGRNFLPAHLTLFHQLPSDLEAVVFADLGRLCAGRFPMPLTVSGLRNLGRGVAYDIASPQLIAFRRGLLEEWRPHLKAQDLRRFHPHVTVQNKVRPDEARRLLAELSTGFAPFEAQGVGVLLWRYLGGPWELIARACDELAERKEPSSIQE